MQLHIWQQFSANHSSGFMVIATFENRQATLNAADKIRNLLKSIERWWYEHVGSPPDPFNDRLTPPEIAFSKQYGLAEKWERPIDPVCYNFDATVTILDRLMIVKDPDETWMEREPFFSLLKILGGQVAGWNLGMAAGREHTTLYEIVLTCKAPDVDTAQKLFEEIHRHFSKRDHPQDYSKPENVPPWYDFEANFVSCQHYEDTLLQADELATVLQLRSHFSPDLAQLAVFDSANPTIMREGRVLQIKGLLFLNPAFAIATMIAYLEVNGCYKIDYYLVPIEADKE